MSVLSLSESDSFSFLLRPMAEEDIPTVQTLHAASFATLAHDWHTPGQIAAHVALIKSVDYIDELLRCHMTLACRHTNILATAGWMAVPDAAQTARIRKVFVHPQMARQGLGSMLVRHVERQARWAGYRRLIVRANINAVGLYTRLGYAAIGRDTMAVANGVDLPVIMMEKLAD